MQTTSPQGAGDYVTNWMFSHQSDTRSKQAAAHTRCCCIAIAIEQSTFRVGSCSRIVQPIQLVYLVPSWGVGNHMDCLQGAYRSHFGRPATRCNSHSHRCVWFHFDINLTRRRQQIATAGNCLQGGIWFSGIFRRIIFLPSIPLLGWVRGSRKVPAPPRAMRQSCVFHHSIATLCVDSANHH